MSEDRAELAEDIAHGRNLVHYVPLNALRPVARLLERGGGELQILSRATEHAVRDNFSLSDVFHNEQHGPLRTDGRPERRPFFARSTAPIRRLGSLVLIDPSAPPRLLRRPPLACA